MRTLLLSSLALLVLALAIPAIAAQPAAPADGLKMEATGKKVVVFNHTTHKDVTCVQCHHPVDGKEDFRKCNTSGCHDNMDRKDKSERGYYQAMHGKTSDKIKSCVACHTEVAAAKPDLKKELTACKGSKCHP